MLKIDGSEGGGQMLRTALALSAITKKPFRMKNIRGAREKPGLKNQHLTCIKAFEKICSAQAKGAEIGSRELEFSPGEIKGGRFEFDIGTAGSITLLMQGVLPALLFANKESNIVLKGGTHVNWSPTIDYSFNVLFPAIRTMGADIEGRINRFGFFPQGGGEVELSIKPAEKMLPFDSERIGKKETGKVHGKISCSNLPIEICERIEKSARKKIFDELGMESSITIESINGISTGVGITLWKDLCGGSALGERGKRAEVVGEEAAQNFINEFAKCANKKPNEKNAACGNELELRAHAENESQNNYVFADSHLADQLLIFMALAEGKSVMRTSMLTEHIKMNVKTIEKFVGAKFEIEEKEGFILIKSIT